MRTLMQDVKLEMKSTRYKTWKLLHLTDAAKVEAELRGDRRPSNGSPYGRILTEAIREARILDDIAGGPVGPVVVPPQPTVLSPIWQLDAVFTRSLSSFSGLQRQSARDAGYSAVYVQLAHTPYVEPNLAEMSVFTREGWKLVGWGTYGQDSEPYEDGLRAAVLCKTTATLLGWKANGEVWAEGERAWKTADFLRGWKAGGAPVPLGWSVLSSDTSNFARSFDYVTALSAAGADIDFQVYGATKSTYTVDACLGMAARAHVPLNRIAMTFDVNGDDDPRLLPGSGPFADYRTWPGPRRIWTGDDSTPDTFKQMARPV